MFVIKSPQGNLLQFFRTGNPENVRVVRSGVPLSKATRFLTVTKAVTEIQQQAAYHGSDPGVSIYRVVLARAKKVRAVETAVTAPPTDLGQKCQFALKHVPTDQSSWGYLHSTSGALNDYTTQRESALLFDTIETALEALQQWVRNGGFSPYITVVRIETLTDIDYTETLEEIV